MQLVTPTFAEFFRRLEREFGVTVLPGPAAPFQNADKAVVLSRQVGDADVRRYVAFRHETDRIERDLLRAVCERLAIDPLVFGVRPRGS